MAIILLDLDDTSADFFGGIADRAYADHGIQLDRATRPMWELRNLPEIGDRLGQSLDAADQDPPFWEGLKLLSPEIPLIVSSWIRLWDAEVYVLTACGPAVYAPKARWVDKHLPMIGRKRMITAHDKWHVKGDILIDDKPETLVKYSTAWPTAKLATIQHPYHGETSLPESVTLFPSNVDPVTAWRSLNTWVSEHLETWRGEEQ
jgi:5'(3')-deoxyribonucleotidase